MTFPSVNAVAGTVGILALAVVVYFGLHQHSHSVVAPRPVAEAKAPAPARVSAPAVMQHKPVVAAPITVKKPVYRKVLPGGKLDGQVNCAFARSLTKSYSDVKTYGPLYAGLSDQQVKNYRVCYPAQ